MKSASIWYKAIGLFFIYLLAFPVPGWSQDSAQAPAFSKEQLAQMLAPIALYPDTLLSQVLMASTYPIEVIEADRWVRRNPDLKGESLNEALLAKDWDPSVKALCHFPTVLGLMSERIGETTNIGNAFLAQEDEVMDMVQELRARAYEQGNLRSSSQQKVIVEKQTIIIEPANPRVIYVPYYDPLLIYGPWWYPAYPPYYWGPSRVSIGVGISYWPGFFFSFAFGTWSYFDWPRHSIYIHVHRRPRYVRRDRWRAEPGRWHHLPRHRRGVAYRDKFTARKYGQYPHRFREFDRGVRGFPDRRNRARPRIHLDRQVRERAERERQGRQRAEQERRVRQRTEQQRPTRQRVDRVRRPPQRAGERRPGRQHVEQERRTRQHTERERPGRQRVEGARRSPERVDRNIFNRVDEGRRERASSRRGRYSREGHRGGESRGRGFSGHGRGRGDGGRGARGRMRR